MIHAPKIYADAGLVAIPVTVDEDAAGVQFDLLYEPSSSYDSIQIVTGASGFANEISAGHLKVAFSGPLNLSNPVCVVTLNIPETTEIVFEGARRATEQAESLPLEADDGVVLIGEDMKIDFVWVDNNPENAGVIDATVYQSNQNDPDAGVWNVVGTVPVGTDQLLNQDLATNQGEVFFHVSFRSALGKGAPSSVKSVNTDLPIAPENFTVTIV